MKRTKETIAALSLAGLLCMNNADANAVEWKKTEAGFVAVHDDDRYVLAGSGFNEGYITKTEPKEEKRKPVDAKKYQLLEEIILSSMWRVKNPEKISVGKSGILTAKHGKFGQPGAFMFYTSPDKNSIKKVLGYQYFETENEVLAFTIEQLFLKSGNIDPRETKTSIKPVYKPGTTKIMMSKMIVNSPINPVMKVEYEGSDKGYLMTYADYNQQEVDVKWVHAAETEKHLKLFEQLQDIYTEKSLK